VSELNQNRYDALVRRVGNLKGPGSKVNDVLEELFPMFDVENMPMELLRLAGIRSCFGGGNLAGVVAESPVAQLFNPAGSGVLVTITSVWHGVNTSGSTTWGVTNTAIGVNIGTATLSDTREVQPDRPVAQVRQLSSGAAATATNQTRTGGNDSFILQDRLGIAVLAPGTGFDIGPGGTNRTINYAFGWRERVFEASEDNF